MRVVITEDIIRNALNESIDEFMINEAMLNEFNWGNAVKGAWGYAKKAGNWLKNAAAMYMDKQTNGQWNKKYGINAKGNGKVIGTYYLKKWFSKHYSRLYDIIWGDYYGNRQYFYTSLNGNNVSFNHDWKNNQYSLYDRNRGINYNLQANEYGVPTMLKVYDSNGNEIAKSTKTKRELDGSYYFNCEGNRMYSLTIYVGEDNSTPESYIAKNCRPENFISETQNGLGAGDFRNAVVVYLKKIQAENNSRMKKFAENPKLKDNFNYNEVLNSFSLAGFYQWWGENANKIKNNSQEGQPQQQQQNQENNNYIQDNPNWYQQQNNYQQNNQQSQYYNQANSPFNNDLGHDAPGVNNNSQHVGKKQEGWHPTNDVPIFKQNK
jgi:hypothetical protein